MTKHIVELTFFLNYWKWGQGLSLDLSIRTRLLFPHLQPQWHCEGKNLDRHKIPSAEHSLPAHCPQFCCAFVPTSENLNKSPYDIIASITERQRMLGHLQKHFDVISYCHMRDGWDSLTGHDGSPSRLCATVWTLWTKHKQQGPLEAPIKWPAPAPEVPYTYAWSRHPIILSIWRVSVDRHEITSRAFFDNCRYSHKDGQPYWRQSQVLLLLLLLCVRVCVYEQGGCLGDGGLQCQTDASENWSRGSLIFIDMSKLILIRIWIAMDCVKQQFNREVLKKDCGQTHFIKQVLLLLPHFHFY